MSAAKNQNLDKIKKFRKTLRYSDSDIVDRIIQTLFDCDKEIIKSIGNGSKWIMTGYYNGIVVKLLQILGRRKVPSYCPGYTFLKTKVAEMNELDLFLETREEYF